MNRGDVVWVDFPGAVQTKRRPAVILSSAAYHAARPGMIVGLITSQTGKAGAPTDHLVRHWQAAGLRMPSAFRAYLVTLPQSAVVSVAGTLDAADLKAVDARVRLALDLR